MEKRLFKKFYQQEDWAVKKVYDKYSRLIKHISFQILHDNDLCDDIVNETFIHLLEKGELETEHNFVAYMCQTARNLSLNIVKERNKFESLSEEEISAEDEKNDDMLAILKKNLEENEYDILILRAVLGYPFKDIADLYKTSSSSIRGIYHRTRLKAKKFLEGIL